MAAADMSWAPPLALPGRGLNPDPVQAIVLAMAEDPVVAPVDAPQMVDRISGYLEQIYGINHPDAITDLLPAVTATYQAVTGSHETDRVDGVFRQQLRHTLTLDGRSPTGRPDAVWEIDHQWKPAPPRQQRARTNNRPRAGAKVEAQARGETSAAPTSSGAPRSTTQRSGPSGRSSAASRRATVRANTRLDELAAVVQAARRRQLARQAAAFHDTREWRRTVKPDPILGQG